MGTILVLIGTLFYTLGEIYSKFLKYIMGIPMGLVYGLFTHNWVTAGLIAISYAIATQFGYGENNWLTKLVGNKWAITICGGLLGLAGYPILGFFALLQALLSAVVWNWLSTKDGVINEPWVGIIRGLSATILLIGV